MNILLTGGSGFVGSALLGRIIENHNIFALGRKIEKFTSDIQNHHNFTFIPFDLTKDAEFSLDMKIDCVIHLAAITSGISYKQMSDYDKLNVLGTRKVVFWAQRNSVRKFIFASSVSVYGSTLKENVATENNFLKGSTNYALSKIYSERIVLDSITNATIFRIASVYGKNSRGLIHKLIKFSENYIVPYPFLGRFKKSFIFIDDLIEFFVRSIETDTKGVFNLSHPEEVLYKDLISLIKKQLDLSILLKIPVNEPLIKMLNILVRIFSLNQKSMDARALFSPVLVNSNKAYEYFDYVPETSIEEGIKKMIMV